MGCETVAQGKGRQGSRHATEGVQALSWLLQNQEEPVDELNLCKICIFKKSALAAVGRIQGDS